MCTGCKGHWIKVIVVVVHSVVSWKQLKCRAERVQMGCLGRGNAMSQRRSELSFYKETGSCRRGRQKRDRTETSRVNWSKAIRGWGAAEHYFSAALSEVLSSQTALVNKTLMLLLQLLLGAKKTNFYALPVHSSLSNFATMDAPVWLFLPWYHFQYLKIQKLSFSKWQSLFSSL